MPTALHTYLPHVQRASANWGVEDCLILGTLDRETLLGQSPHLDQLGPGGTGDFAPRLLRRYVKRAELVALLSRRAQNVVEIGRLKGLLQMEIYQPAREEAVLRHVRSVNTGPLDGDAIARLFERIIDEARRLERAMAERGHK